MGTRSAIAVMRFAEAGWVVFLPEGIVCDQRDQEQVGGRHRKDSG